MTTSLRELFSMSNMSLSNLDRSCIINPGKSKIAYLFISCFIFLTTVFQANTASATNVTCTWVSVTPTNTCIGSLSNYTLRVTYVNNNSAAVPIGKAVVITFPAGFTLNTISGGTYNGTAIGTITTTATTVSFNTPVAVPKNTTFNIVLNGITNNSTSGNYQLAMTVDNTTGTGAGNQNIFAAGANSQFTINPNPAMTSSNTATICSGGTVSIPLTSNVASSYTWIATDNSNTTGESLTNQTTSTLSNTIINNTNTTQTVTYTVTPTSTAGSCVGSAQTVTVTVNPTPFVTAQTATICSGSSFSVTPANGGGNIIPASTNYTWTAPAVTGGITGGSAQGTPQSSIGQTLTNPTNVAQTATYTVTPIGPNCTGATFTITVTVNPVPFITAQAASICNGTSFLVTPVNGGGNIVPVGTNYTWNDPVLTGGITGGSAQGTPQVSISQTLTNPTGIDQTATYTVTPIGPDCTGATFSITITVHPTPTIIPTADAGTAVTTCSNSGEVNITGGSSATNEVSVTWTSNGAGTITNPASLTLATYTPTASENTAGATITLTLTATGAEPCSNATSNKSLTITKAPIATAGTAVTTCSNSGAVNITAGSSASNQASIVWTSNGAGTIADPTSLTLATYTPTAAENTAGATITLTLTANGNAPCGNATSNKSLVITKSPTSTAGTTVTTCSNSGAVNITTGSSATDQASVTWTSNGAGTIANATSLTLATYTPTAAENTAGATITLTLTANGNAPCGNATSNKSLIITKAPTATAGTAVTTCSTSGAVNITAGSSATNQAGITWTSNGAGTIANPTSLTLATYTPTAGENTTGATITLALTATGNTPCGNATSNKSLVITKAPVATAGTAVSTCSTSGAVNITAGSSATDYSSVLWTSSGTGTWTNQSSLTLASYTPSTADTTAGSVTLTLTANGNAPCGNNSSNKTLTIYHVSVGGALTVSGTSPASNLKTICPSPNNGSITLSGHSGNVIRWESSLDGGYTWNTISNTTTTLNYTNLNQTTVYRAIVQSGVCSIASSLYALISVVPPVTPSPVIATPSTICQGQSSILTASPGYLQWPSAIDGTFNSANPPGWDVTENGVGINFPANANNSVTNPWSESNGPKTLNGIVYDQTTVPGLSGKFAVCSGIISTFLETPAFTTIGMTEAVFTYMQAFNLNSNSWAKVEISLNGGASYIATPLLQYNGAMNFGVPDNGWLPVTIDLGNYIGQSNIRLRFNYSGGSGAQLSNWAIDGFGFPSPPPPVTYTWTPAIGLGGSGTGTPITATPDTTTTYTIYSVVAGCPGGNQPVTVTVIPLPSFSAQPSDKTSCVGVAESFSTTVTNATGGTYQWQVRNPFTGTWSNVTNGGVYSGALTSTLSLSSTTYTMADYYYRLRFTKAPCAVIYSDSSQLKLKHVWMGYTSTDWQDANQWSGKILPVEGCDVYIPSRTFKPRLSTGPIPQISNLIVYTGGDLSITNSATLRIRGAITSTREITASQSGIIELNGTSGAAQSISGTMFKGKSVSSLIASNTNIVNVLPAADDTLRILSSLTFGTSTADVNAGNNLTLVSIDTATAAVGQMGAGNQITNKVTVERFISRGRKWRFLGVPINSGFQTVKESWQEGAVSALQNPKPGYGIMVTDSLFTWNSYGFDGLSPGVTVKQFDPASKRWIGITATSKDISDWKGYMTFVRGNRGNQQLSIALSTTVLRVTGTLKQGAQTAITIPTAEFVSIGNPYASTLDMRNINKSAGVQDFFYTWDPMLSGLYTVGGYQTFSKDIETGNYEITPGGGSYGNPVNNVYNTIESGQGFFVRGGAGGTLTFNENAKATGSEMVFFTPGAAQKLRANMHILNTDGTKVLADGILVDYNDAFSNKADDLDALKAVNANENVSIKSGNNLFIIERRHTIESDDTIRLHMSGVKVSNYQWELIAKNLDADGRSGFFIDKYTGTSTPLNLAGTTIIRISIQNIPGSYANDRFMIVFKQKYAPLPVAIPSISATRNSDNTITVNWKIANERDMQQYLVDRSADGVHFTSIANQLPIANNGTSPLYTQLDANPLYVTNYYRIKALSSGAPMYSAVVKVEPLKSESIVTVYPNPVTGKKMNVRFYNLPAGDYKVELINTIGQSLFSTVVQVNSINENKVINLGKLVTSGNYQLKVTGEDGTRRMHAVMVE